VSSVSSSSLLSGPAGRCMLRPSQARRHKMDGANPAVVQAQTKTAFLSGGARLAFLAGAEGRIWSVDNVHTLGLGLGRIARIPHVSGGA